MHGRLVLTDNGLPQPASVAFDFKVRVANRPKVSPVASAGKDVTAAGSVWKWCSTHRPAPTPMVLP